MNSSFSFNFDGIANFDESKLHFCENAASQEDSKKESSIHSRITKAPTSNPSNSTAEESHDNHVSQHDFTTEISILIDSQAIINTDSKYPSAMSSKVTAKHSHILDTTRSIGSPAETAEGSPISGGNEGINYNDGTVLEVEKKVKAKVEQSKYKNKLKELFQKAVKIYNYLKNLKVAGYNKIKAECEKSDEDWLVEGEILKMLWNNLLDDLEAKQYCCFVELYKLMPEIIKAAGDIVENFNSEHKKKISKAYFKKNADKFESKDLFSWMLLIQIVLVLLPEDQEYLELFPLKKSTICMATWLLDSKMNSENKEIYRNPADRSHLRKVMTEIYNNLMNQNSIKIDQNRLDLLQRISNALGTSFAPMQESPRRVARVVSVRSSPQHCEIDSEITEKRGFSRAPKLPKDKLRKQRK